MSQSEQGGVKISAGWLTAIGLGLVMLTAASSGFAQLGGMEERVKASERRSVELAVKLEAITAQLQVISDRLSKIEGRLGVNGR